MARRWVKFRHLLTYSVLAVGGVSTVVMCVGTFGLSLFGITDRHIIDTRQQESIQQVTGYTELTTEQRLSDLDEYLAVLEEKTPYVNQMETDFGYSPFTRADYYREMVSKCEDDYQFVALMDAIGRDVSSCHSRFSIVDYDAYINPAYINAPYEVHKNVENAQQRITAFRDYLCEKQTAYDSREAECVLLGYFNGEYVVQSDYQELYLGRILAMDKHPVEDYLQTHLLYSTTPKYNSNLQEMYVDTFLLVNQGENPVEVLMEREDGHVISCVLYTDIDVAYAFCRGSKYRSADTAVVSDRFLATCKNTFEVKTDEQSKLAYVIMPSFGLEDGTQMQEEISKISDYQNIVLDVRDNGGGRAYIWRDYIYPALFNESMVYNNCSYMAFTKKDNDIYPGLCNGFFSELSQGEIRQRTNCMSIQLDTDENMDFYMVSEPHYYSGNKGLTYDSNRKIVILVNGKTASAADSFAATFQEKGLATVVGTQTAGEGFIIGQAVGELSNSLMQYVYVPSTYLNRDGKINNIYGTVPDIYAVNTMEDYRIRIELQELGKDDTDLENRKIWDSQFRMACTLLEEDEN